MVIDSSFVLTTTTSTSSGFTPNSYLLFNAYCPAASGGQCTVAINGIVVALFSNTVANHLNTYIGLVAGPGSTVTITGNGADTVSVVGVVFRNA